MRWFDLYEAIKAGGHRLMLSIADLGWGSVIGNTLDHGITYMPYGVDMAMQCGMEVVLPNGELMRTGMGAMPGNRSWNLYKRGLGPTPDQLFMQSNFGIVTKMGVWLMPDPRSTCRSGCGCGATRTSASDRHAADADARRHDPHGPAGDEHRPARRRCSRRATSGGRRGPDPDRIIDKMARELEIGRWMMRFALYEDEAVVDHKFAKIKEAFGRIEGAEVVGHQVAPEDIPDLEHPAERIQGGVPTSSGTT